MIALVRMRLGAFVRTGAALAPLIGALVVLATIYGGGVPAAGEGYGFSAAILFPVLAWQTKILLDAEPDVQRRLAGTIVRREWVAGLLAAAVPALVVVVLALTVPLLFGWISADGVADVALGLWAHAALAVPAVVFGALASRAVTGSVGRGVAVLAGGSVLAFVVGVRSSPVPWLAPPVMAVARATNMPANSLHTTLWTIVALALYARLRRT